MATFDLTRFAQNAFGASRLPDHPLASDKDADAAMRELDGESPENALAQITYYLKSMNDTHSFSAGRRAVVLLRLHEASEARWRALGTRYLKVRGAPSEHRDGDPNLLRALFDSASEFSTGFGLSLDEAPASEWVRENLPALCARKMRWLGRRLALAHMLRLPGLPAIWEALHRSYAFAEEHNAARQVGPVFQKAKFPTCARQEYVRAALLELAAPQSLPAREVELAWRIAGRVARMVRLERKPGAGRHPLPEGAPVRLYLDTENCLPALREQHEAPGEAKAADAALGGDFTVREHRAMLEHALKHWGAAPPRRAAQRVALSAGAEVLYNFDTIAKALPSAEPAPAASPSALAIDQTGKLQRQARARATATFPARVVDASAGGLGLSIPGSPAWLKPGVLVAVRIHGKPEWLLATVRRVFAPAEKERRVGLQVLSSHPRSFTFEGQDLNTVWEEAARQEIRSSETSHRGVILHPEGFARARGEILLPPGIGRRNQRLEVRSRGDLRTLKLSPIEDDGAQYERAAYEVLPASVAA